MNQINTTLTTIMSEIWAKTPNLALVILILFLHFRMEDRMDTKFSEMSDRFEKRFQAIDTKINEILAEFKIQSYRLDAHEKRIEKLEGK